jgi:two-component system chemotaxis response regulator CheY
LGRQLRNIGRADALGAVGNMIRPTILIVDDSSLQRRAIAGLLESYNCRVLEAMDGSVALQIVRAERPDVVILDYNMPVMDGLEFLQHLRSDPSFKSLPVIMLTANAAPATLAAAARFRVRDYLLKPVDGSVLIAKLSRIVELQTKTPSGSIAENS